MERAFIEATNGLAGTPVNWGKFLVIRLGAEEWSHQSAAYAPGGALLRQVRWGRDSLIVFDLQTGEGVKVLPRAGPKEALARHQVWVCPLFEPFLEWLYRQDLSDLSTLPPHVHLPDVPIEMRGYRRRGPGRIMRWLANRPVPRIWRKRAA